MLSCYALKSVGAEREFVNLCWLRNAVSALLSSRAHFRTASTQVREPGMLPRALCVLARVKCRGRSREVREEVVQAGRSRLRGAVIGNRFLAAEVLQIPARLVVVLRSEGGAAPGQL